jgi:carboxyl-terminal processing protease
MLARITAVLCGLVLLAGVGAVGYSYGSSNAAPARTEQASSSQGSLEFLEEILGALDDDAVRAPDDEKLVGGAVEGMFKALDDPYARYYGPDAFQELNAMLDGGFSGIGVVLEEKPKGLIIITVLENTPAARAGVEKGERIISVDGQPVGDIPLEQIVEMVKGDEGTDVKIGLAGGPKGKRELTLTRQRIEIPNVESRLLSDGGGYVQMRQFTKGVAEDVRVEVTSLVDRGAKGLVLDLRGNPGGLLNEAVNVASIFMEEGEVVSVKERGTPQRSYTAKGDAIEGLPLVVLVDKGSASASEIVAGAIQDANRGTLVGQRTFGKGTVQTIHRLDAGGGVKYTTAEYFTPSGDSIEDVGVRPDRKVTNAEDQLAAAQDELRALIAAGGDDNG